MYCLFLFSIDPNCKRPTEDCKLIWALPNPVEYGKGSGLFRATLRSGTDENL